jgi:hypothetical protein
MAALGIAGTMAIIGTAAKIGGTIIGAVGQARAGRAEKEAAYFEAGQMESLAGEERAAGQQEAFEIDRQVNTLLSIGRAAAAASGAGGSDIGVANVQADLARGGEVRSQMGRYTAEQRAQGLETQAKVTRMGGNAAQRAGRLAAFGTIIGGFGEAASGMASWSATYGERAPVTQPAGDFMTTAPSSSPGLLRRIFGGA